MLTKKQINEIREHLEKAQNPLFFFDNDPDGLCSFLLLQRYIGRGMPTQKALVAISRKLLRILFALVRDHREYVVNYSERENFKLAA